MGKQKLEDYHPDTGLGIELRMRFTSSQFTVNELSELAGIQPDVKADQGDRVPGGQSLAEQTLWYLCSNHSRLSDVATHLAGTFERINKTFLARIADESIWGDVLVSAYMQDRDGALIVGTEAINILAQYRLPLVVQIFADAIALEAPDW